MQDLINIVVLAVVQGIAEFLPISSSGHLVVLNELFGTGKGSLELNIILHLGTLLAILVFYHRRILDLLGSDRRVIPLLIVGTLPAAVFGIFMKKNYETFLENALVAGLMLPLTGVILLLLRRIPRGEEDYQQIGYVTAILIGCAQAFAILPGISRSGATIVAGAALGLKRQSAATFSFLLAIPAIAGATVLELKDMFDNGGSATAPSLLLIGAVVAFVVGLFSLNWLVRWLEQGRLHYFAFWVIPLGIVVVLWQLWTNSEPESLVWILSQLIEDWRG